MSMIIYPIFTRSKEANRIISICNICAIFTKQYQFFIEYIIIDIINNSRSTVIWENTFYAFTFFDRFSHRIKKSYTIL